MTPCVYNDNAKLRKEFYINVNIMELFLRNVRHGEGERVVVGEFIAADVESTELIKRLDTPTASLKFLHHVIVEVPVVDCLV